MLEALSQRVAAALECDATPLADSPHDAGPSLVRGLCRAGRAIELVDLSSSDAGFRYPNVNSMPLGLIAQLLAREGASGPEIAATLAAVRRARANGRRLSFDELTGLFGRRMVRLFPHVAADPGVNVNFADPVTLRVRLQTALGAHRETAATLSEHIIELRSAMEIDEPMLTALVSRCVGARERRRVLASLGVRTWVWGLTIDGKRGRLVKLLARLPGRGANRFRLVGSYFEERSGAGSRRRFIGANESAAR